MSSFAPYDSFHRQSREDEERRKETEEDGGTSEIDFQTAKVFYRVQSNLFLGLSVKCKLIIYVLGVVLIFISAGQGQLVLGSAGESSTGNFQSVGGEFGKAWINNFLATSGPPVQTTNNTSLWTWGDMPVGKTLVNGKLVPADNNGTVITRATDWMGDMPLGAPISLNGSYNTGLQSPLSDMYLSDDPWIRAQQLGTVVRTPLNYQPAI
jgi:hypothetical protein